MRIFQEAGFAGVWWPIFFTLIMTVLLWNLLIAVIAQIFDTHGDDHIARDQWYLGRAGESRL